ncbi:MAG: ATP-binding cassette domain-containing protein, partial [Alphaproteobacteria bacterium]|nr:ATP-binding cassette domain-containing protein [Alphaproteobacteria bacterium]
MTYFALEDVSIQFGGLKAVDGVSFDVAKGEIFTIIGPNGAGKTTLFNLISRLYNVTTGRIVFKDEEITQLNAQQIAGRGIARTFQNIELFDNASVLQNLLVGRHRHSTTRFWEDLFFLPRVRREEVGHRHAVEEVMEFLRLQRYRDTLI